MKELILGIMGAAAMIGGAVYLIRLLMLRKKGVTANAEVAAVREGKRNSYVHLMRYETSSGTAEHEDRAGYSQPLNVGDKRLVVYDPDDPSRFEFESDLKHNITIAAVLIAVGAVFAVRWLIIG